MVKPAISPASQILYRQAYDKREQVFPQKNYTHNWKTAPESGSQEFSSIYLV